MWELRGRGSGLGGGTAPGQLKQRHVPSDSRYVHIYIPKYGLDIQRRRGCDSALRAAASQPPPRQDNPASPEGRDGQQSNGRQPSRPIAASLPGLGDSRPGRFRIVAEDADVSGDVQRPEDNPSIDDIVLDDAYYREMGISPEEVAESRRLLEASEVDPEGQELSPGELPAAIASLSAARAAAAGEAARKLGHGMAGPGGSAGGGSGLARPQQRPQEQLWEGEEGTGFGEQGPEEDGEEEPGYGPEVGPTGVGIGHRTLVHVLLRRSPAW